MRIVCFDLDGTITRHDTLTPYVFGWLLRRPWRWPRLLGVLPAVLRFVGGARDHGALKAALIHHTMGGAHRAEVAAWTAQFVPRLLSSGVFAQAVAAIQSHRGAGDQLLLMSASVDLYVPAIGAALGFAQTICTSLVWKDDLLDGRLASANCRGAEKLRQLTALRDATANSTLVAYGNSAPDMVHLRFANNGFLVNGTAELRRQAARDGLTVLTWS